VTYSDDWDGIDAWLDEVSPTMSLIASATAAVLDTQAIVLGGLIPPALAKRLIQRIEFYDIRRGGVERERANVILARCCDDPAATGAALLPFLAKFFTL
jgi:predicted NBD/HSP70 family sugar kinase